LAIVLQRRIGNSLARAYEQARNEAAHRGAATRHARRRARERHDADLDAGSLAALEAGIRTGTWPAFARASGGRTLHAVPGPRGPMPAVWCPALDRIVTFLHSH